MNFQENNNKSHGMSFIWCNFKKTIKILIPVWKHLFSVSEFWNIYLKFINIFMHVNLNISFVYVCKFCASEIGRRMNKQLRRIVENRRKLFLFKCNCVIYTTYL